MPEYEKDFIMWQVKGVGNISAKYLGKEVAATILKPEPPKPNPDEQKAKKL